MWAALGLTTLDGCGVDQITYVYVPSQSKTNLQYVQASQCLSVDVLLLAP